MSQLIIFTDLDGTLLDHDNYTYTEAAQALTKIKEKSIPLIFCTSKTRAEIEVYRQELDNPHPFISENGGAIFIPKRYFRFHFDYDFETDQYLVVQLGEKISRLRQVIGEMKSRGVTMKCFGDMAPAEIARDAGLSEEQAELSKMREFDEVFMIEPNHAERAKRIIEENNLNMTRGGRYYHLMGRSDKGKAVKLLTGLYKKKYVDVNTVGLGDSSNDFAMLDNVDIPYLVQKPNGEYSSEDYEKAEGIGPKGWNRAVLELLDDGLDEDIDNF